MNCRPGETVAAYFRRRKALGPASQRGVQRLVGRKWEKVSLSYVCRAGDRLRVAAPEDSGSAEMLKSVLRDIGAPL